MKLRTRLHHVVLAVLLAASQASAFGGAYIQIGYIDGESTAPDHEDWIDVLGFRWGVQQAVSHRTDPAGGRRPLAATFSDLTVTKRTDKATPLLMLACAKGQHFETVTYEMALAGEPSQVYLKIELTDVIVSSWSTSGDADNRPVEEVTLNFAQVLVTYREYDDQGGFTEEVIAGWDVEANAPLPD